MSWIGYFLSPGMAKAELGRLFLFAELSSATMSPVLADG
jgi:hypothetical protein